MDFKDKLILAPMARVTSMPFRVLCKRHGADIVMTEMINSHALARRNKSTMKMIEYKKIERPIGIQLFGGVTGVIIKAARMIEKDFDFIDLNLGCPSYQVLNQGAGAALLRRPNKVREIVSKLANNIRKPITIKIRSGFDAKHINAVEIAKICEDAGAEAITVHARTAIQGYSGRADWSIIKNVRNNVDIPVIGNGDVFNHHDAERMKEETGCDSIMIGRGALGNPFIFEDIKHYFRTKKEPREHNIKEKINELLKMADSLDMVDLRIHTLYFIKNMYGAAQLRLKLSKIKTKYRMIKELRNLI